MKRMRRDSTPDTQPLKDPKILIPTALMAFSELFSIFGNY